MVAFVEQANAFDAPSMTVWPKSSPAKLILPGASRSASVDPFVLSLTENPSMLLKAIITVANLFPVKVIFLHMGFTEKEEIKLFESNTHPLPESREKLAAMMFEEYTLPAPKSSSVHAMLPVNSLQDILDVSEFIENIPDILFSVKALFFKDIDPAFKDDDCVNVFPEITLPTNVVSLESLPV